LPAHTKNDIIVSEKKRPVWQSIVAGVSYALMFLFLGLMIFGVYQYDGRQSFMAFTSSFNCAVFMLIFGLRFSVITSIYFDMAGSRYKKEYRVGRVRMGRWKQLPGIEYVSVFKQAVTLPGEDDGHVFNVNVWYGQNRHFTIYTNSENKSAYEMGMFIASRLKIELLDATDPLNKIWITPWVETESFGLPAAKVNNRGLR
jgi:hypothetical protein